MTSAKNSLWILKERAEIERDMLQGNVNSRLLEGKKQDFVIARLSARASLAFPVNQECVVITNLWDAVGTNTWMIQHWWPEMRKFRPRRRGKTWWTRRIAFKAAGGEAFKKRNAQRREAYLREKIKLPEDLVLFWEEQEKALGAKGHQWHPK